VPLGAVGDLYIGGDGLARGYLNRPELTAERFIPDPFSDEPGARMYKTGDLARYRADGAIEFLGRSDFQVKVRGHRIELGEIESCLLEHPQVRETVVVARELTPGDQRLLAYWAPVNGVTPSVGEFREYCQQHLPEHMVPHHFVKVAALPQTPNGKIDRNALPAFQDGDTDDAAQVLPQGELEQRIAAIWQDVLKTSAVSVTTNFFDLGGHSLLALQVHRRLVEAVQPDLALTDIFRFPTVRAMAEFVASRDTGSDDRERVAVERGNRRRDALAMRARSRS
jgi:hypothetical protein